ncbi:MAG: GRP family sugar transporter [Bacteroidia bacterium]|nr:GRP family sugar transporter [Bacteroidia bacterium]
MFIVETYPLAVAFCIITMLCWGSWANTQKLAAASWRFELFYWDYVLGIVLFALLAALTLGSFGAEGRSFLPDLRQAGSGAAGSALLGGVLFNAANILLGAAIAVAGMSVAFPVGIGLALVIGVGVNYLDAPLGSRGLLGVGVLLIAAAILLNASAYRRTSARSGGVSRQGLLLSVMAGLLMGFFYKYVAQAMFPDFRQPLDGKLSPYTAVVLFSAGILLSNFLFNTLLMRRPVTGAPLRYADYAAGSFRTHLVGVLGGAIWCAGMLCSVLASGEAGPAISYGLGQGATVVAALWGMLIWKEFDGAPKEVPWLLGLMLLLYAAGLALLVAAR